MSKSADPFEAWQNGHSAVVFREVAGLPVDPRWEQRLSELEQHCMGLEIFAWGARREPLRGTQGGQGGQGELFARRIQAHERGM
jgi:hypothetical protein